MKSRYLFILLFTLASQVEAQQLFTTEVKGHGKSMILIHGLYCNGDVWKETVEHYQKNYECHILTLAGFGGNEPKLSDHFLEMVKDDVIVYARKLHKPVLVGHSMGGFISFWAAASAPGVFEKVIAVDGLPFLPAVIYPNSTPETSKPMAASIKAGMENQTPAQIEAGQKQYLPTMITSQEQIEQVTKIASKADPKTQGEVMYELYTIDLRKTVAAIDCPVMLMGAWIAYKQYGVTHESTVKNYEAQVTGIKNCSVQINDTARHFIFYDDPTWFFEKLDGFLNKI